ncbi:MAG: FAD-dependent oxidoreductase [Telluria sp.]
MSPARAPLRIGVIGAGTAGLATAIALARDGHVVDVLEKHPAHATLGAGVLIQPQGVRALDALGVGAPFRAASVPIVRLHGLNERGWTLVDLRYGGREARAVSRAALGAVLLEAARAAGARLRFGCEVDELGIDGNEAFLRCGTASERYDVAVIANGASSGLATAAGMAVPSERYPWGALWGMFDVDHCPADLLQQRFHTARTMIGIMPTEMAAGKLRVSLFWSLHRDAVDAWRAAPLARWRERFLALWPEAAPVVNQIERHEQLTFAAYYHARPAVLARPPVCIVGDAAHAMSPQLGLGSTLAVQDALALAQALREDGAHAGLLRYSNERLCAVRTAQMLSRWLTPCFQADRDARWRDWLFAASLVVPGGRWLAMRSVAM